MFQKDTTATLLTQGNLFKKTLIESIKTGDKVAFSDAAKQMPLLMFRDEHGNTLLHLAVQAPKNSLFFTNHLLESGAIPINSRNELEETPLYLAVKQGNIQLVRLLMAYNANPYAEDSQGQTALSLAISQNQSAILSIFSGITAVDMGLESLKLRENILSLTDSANLVTETLNNLPVWFEKLPLRYHTLLLQLQKELVDRSLLAKLGKAGKPKKLKRDSTPEKEKRPSKLGKGSKPKEKSDYRKRVLPILNALEALKEGLTAEGPEIYKGILNQLEQLSLYYQSAPEETLEKSEENLHHLRIQSPILGYRDLSKPAAKRFTRYFFEGTERAKQDNYKMNQYGLHDVIQMNRTHYKISPTAPGIEYAVHTLGQLFTGQASAPTELLVIEQSYAGENGELQVQFLPVLASQTISGVLFKELIDQQPSAVQHLEPYNFSLQCVLALLACTVDGKPDNFMAKPQFDAQGQLMHYLLVGIDNDEAFADPIFAAGSSTKYHSLMLKSCLFCLPQADQPVDFVLRKQLLEQNPARLVLRWLSLLQKYNEAFEAKGVSTHYLQGILSEVGLPLRFVPKTAVKLYQTLCRIQTALKAQPELTHMQLMEACYPLVALYYETIRKKAQGEINKATELVYRGPLFEELPLTPAQTQALQAYSENSGFYKDERKQSMLQAAQEFCESLDFSTLDKETQHAVLRQFITDFPGVTHLTLNQCSVLDGTILQEMGKYFTHLEQLVLRNGDSFSAQGMHALLQRFPNLWITLDGLKAFKPHDLLTVSRFCSHLYLILNDGSKQLVDKKNQFLLPAALKQKDLGLITFLLLAGFHLTEEAERYSPLHEAVQQKQAALVQALVDYGSNPNQYLRKVSLLDKTYQLLQSMLATETTTQEQLREILGILVEGGALESRFAGAILAMGKTLWQKNPASLERWVHFALAHNQLNADLVNTWVPSDSEVVDWSRRVPFGYQLTDETLQALFTKLRSLKTLNLSGCEGVTRQHLQQCTRLKLQTLILNFQQAIETGLLAGSDLNLTLQKAGIQVQINAAQLNGSKMVQAQFPQLIQVLSQPQNQVKRLEMTNCVLSLGQIQQLANGLACQTQLKCVQLRNIGLGQIAAIGESHLALLIQQWKAPHLLELYLDNNGLKAEQASVWVKWLPNHPTLKEFSLYGNPLGDEGLMTLAPALRNCRQLVKLSLNETGLTDSGLANWLQKGVPPQVTALDVGYNQLTEKSVAGILELIRLNESITELGYAGQAALEGAMPQRILEGLLQQNAQSEQQRTLLQPYQASFFQKKLPKPRPLPTPPTKPVIPVTPSPNRIAFQRKPKRRMLRDKLAESVLFQSPVAGPIPTPDKETTLLRVQLTTTVKEADEMDQMIDKPLIYQKSMQVEIDRSIEDNEREQTALERDLTQLKNNKQVNQTQIDQLQSQLQMLAMQQEALWRQYERKIAQQTAIAAFDQHPALCLFYNTIQLKLEELFIGCKAIASQLLKAAPGTLSNVSKELSVGVDLLGDTLSFIPGLKMIVGATTATLEMIDEKQASNQAKYIARLGSVKVLLKAAEQTARYLTEAFQDQLKAIDEDASTASPLPSVAKPVKELALKGIQAMLKSNTKQVIQNVADIAVARILSALASQKIEGGSLTALTKQFVFAATKLSDASVKSRALFKVTLPQEIKNRFKDKVNTAQGSAWIIKEMYRKPGIVTNDGRYFTHTTSDPVSYGYRYGSEAEAKKLGMKESYPVSVPFQTQMTGTFSLNLESPRFNANSSLALSDISSVFGPSSSTLTTLTTTTTTTTQSASASPFWNRALPNPPTATKNVTAQEEKPVAQVSSASLSKTPGMG